MIDRSIGKEGDKSNRLEEALGIYRDLRPDSQGARQVSNHVLVVIGIGLGIEIKKTEAKAIVASSIIRKENGTEVPIVEREKRGHHSKRVRDEISRIKFHNLATSRQLLEAIGIRKIFP